MMLNRRCLFQQFIVDAYTIIESERLTFNRKNDKDLRSETYSKLATLAQNLDFGVKLRGKKVILNSNFTRSPRYMMQNYLDGMTLCKFYGYPDLFITFTCNPNWLGISRFMAKRGLKSEDRPDVISRVFKIKLVCLMKELKDGHTFGRVKGVVYTIEFQKRGLLHCHILLWIETENKITTTGKIDEYISIEIPNKDEDPELVSATVDGKEVNEIKDFLNCRYLSSCEAAWCIYGFEIHYRTASVERLPFHLKDEQQVIFDATESIDYVVDKSSVNETKFESWMELNLTDPFARTLLYFEIPKFYVWNEKQRIWTRRKQVRGPMEWDDLKKVDDVLYPTYRDACYARGLFMSRPEIVCENTWMKLVEDVLNVKRIKQGIPDLELSDIQRKNMCLSYIECMLRSNNRSLKDIQNMPYPDQEYRMDGYNRLIYDETLYNKDQLREQHVKLYGSLKTEQKGIYSTIMDDVDNNKGGMFFVYGYGGTRKTYLYKTMSDALHSKGDIVLNVASSSIAALLLEGEWTAHSRFAIPINVVEDSMTDASVASDKVFGGKVVLFGGDFRQILPVITNGDRHDVVNATINSSYLWKKCTVLRLTVNIRLGSGSTKSKKKEIQEFSDWILEIGNRKVGGANDGESTILFPDNMLIPDDDVGAIIDDIYPNLLQNL
ncbi:DNA helicase PIF1, ATP-dependent [Tanacetum coccineum]